MGWFDRWKPGGGGASSGERRSSAPEADAAMARYAVTGDPRDFAIVYDALEGRLFAWIRRKVGTEEIAEEVLQQTFLQMHRARGTFQPGAQVTPWAFAIAGRLCIDHQRRRRTRDGVIDDSDDDVESAGDPRSGDAESLAVAGQLADATIALLAEMSDKERTCFDLSRVQGLTHDEIAQMTGWTISSIKAALNRVTRRLADLKDAERHDPKPRDPPEEEP